MKALAIDGYGFEHVSYRDVEDPVPGPGEVVVSLEAAALNHLDLWTLSGALKVEHSWPHVLGADGAGIVESCGEGVRLRAGSKVIVNPGISCGGCEFCRAGEQSLCTTFQMLGEHLRGTLGEKVKVPASNVFPYPNHLGIEEAAALGVTFVTAYRMLFTRGDLKPGEWVLIPGIGGGLAQALFELARPVAGRILVTSSSARKLELALEMGADEAIDYKRDDIGKTVRRLTGKRGVDLIVDSAGGDAMESALRALRKGGRIVIAGATAGAKTSLDVRRMFWNQLSVIGSSMGSHADVSEMLRMIAGTRIRPRIDRTFDLADGVEALRYLETQEQFGKVVVRIG